MKNKAYLIDLLRDFANGKLSTDDEKAVKMLIDSDEDAKKIWEKFSKKYDEKDLYFSDDEISRLSQKSISKLNAVDINKIEPGQIWEVAGFPEQLLIISNADNSITSNDFRVVTVSNNLPFAEKYDLLITEKSLVVHLHLSGNVHTSKLLRLKDVLDDSTAQAIIRADRKQKLEESSLICYGGGVSNIYADDYGFWREEIESHLDNFQEEILEIYEGNYVIFTLPSSYNSIRPRSLYEKKLDQNMNVQKKYKSVRMHRNYDLSYDSDKPRKTKPALAAATTKKVKEKSVTYKGLYNRDEIRIDFIVKKLGYGFIIIINDDSINSIDSIILSNTRTIITKKDIKLSVGVAEIFYDDNEIKEEFLLEGFKLELVASSINVNCKFKFNK